MSAENAAEAAGHSFREIQLVEKLGARGLELLPTIAGTARLGNEGAAEVGIRFTGPHPGVHVDRNIGRGLVDEILQALGPALAIEGDLEAEGTAKRELLQRDVDGFEPGFLLGVGTDDEVVEEVENGGIGQALRSVESLIGEGVVEADASHVAARGVLRGVGQAGPGEIHIVGDHGAAEDGLPGGSGGDGVARRGGVGVGEDEGRGPVDLLDRADRRGAQSGVEETGIDARIVGDLAAGAECLEAGRQSRVKPRRQAVGRRQQAGIVRDDAATFVGGPDDRRIEHAAVAQPGDIPGGGGEFALGVSEGELLLVLLVVLHRGNANGEFAAARRGVVVEGQAIAPVAADGCLDLAARALEFGGQGAGVDDAGGTADAEEQRVGSAVDFDTVGIVAVHRDDGAVEVSRLSGLGEAAHAGAGRAVAEAGFGGETAARRGDTGIVSAKAADLHVGLINEQVAEVFRARVLEEFRGDDGDGRAQIGKLRTQAGARERLAGFIADVLFGRDRERRKNDGLTGGRRRPGRVAGRRRGRLRV